MDRVMLLDKSVLQLSVTALFYLEDSRKIHLWGEKARRSKDPGRRAPQRAGERERELASAPLFICFSLPGPVLCKLGQPGVLFVLPEVLTLVLGSSFILFFQASRIADIIQYLSFSDLFLSRECMFLDSLSRHNKDLGWRTLKPPRRVTALRSWTDCVIALRSQMDRVIALRQISVTAQCYSSILFRR